MVGALGSGKKNVLGLWDAWNKVLPILKAHDFIVLSGKKDGLRITVWDFCGLRRIQPPWRPHYDRVAVLVLVVDSTDVHAIGESADQLFLLLDERDIHKRSYLDGVPLLIMATKQDVEGCFSPEVMAVRMGLHRIENRLWHVQGVSCIWQTGIKESLDWIGEHSHK
jgi:signal recognition particle receptor subunit beta